MTAFIDKVGMVFGYLLVLSRATNNRHGQAMWLCKCTREGCGREVIVAGCNLKSGHTKSCGCIYTMHGLSGTRAYRAWRNMMDRCYDTKCKDYKWYGAIGRTVCERWHDFLNFYADMGECPPGMQLDRFPNNDGDYEPSNCRWATRIQNARNKSTNRYIIVDGVRMTVAEAAEIHGIKASTIYQRLNHGWSDNDAVLTPVGQKRTRTLPQGEKA